MSSHHFVKEGQEPALFIIHALSLELVQPLLEWAPLVIVMDSAIDEVLHWGIKIDAVISTTAGIPVLEEKLADQFPITIQPYAIHEDAFEKGISFLIASGNTAVTIVTELPQTKFQLATAHPELQFVLMDDKLKWSRYTTSFEKWMTANTPVFIHKEKSDQTLLLDGLIPDGDQFSTMKDGRVQVKSDSGFWIGEQP
ncbi:MAG TPA: hypothetical protein VIN08_19430 [Ohtaekwangia sp.]|uniref:hypothetical protein n=1 Tax=Ohtaekwangia sp. TaxID=2066019 RepID=UPI002F94DDC1